MRQVGGARELISHLKFTIVYGHSFSSLLFKAQGGGQLQPIFMSFFSVGTCAASLATKGVENNK